MNCPHCHQPIDPQTIRKAANSDAAKRKRPNARGLIRNPAGRPKQVKVYDSELIDVNEDSAVVCSSQLRKPPMKVCYCDESGTGDEPIAVMVGIIVDSLRMHITKKDWCELLEALSLIAGRQITELHTRNFYAGNGPWRNVDGPTRVKIVNYVISWLGERKHKIVYVSACKKTYKEMFALQFIPDELNTVWRFMGFHLVLAIQKYGMTFDRNKGNTLLIFDNEHREQLRFTDIICHPRPWSGEYYEQGKKQESLDQIIDVPYFGDSEDESLIQAADFLAYFFRRYAEIRENLVPPRYEEEAERIDGWISSIAALSIGRSYMYPKRSRNTAQEMFYKVASASIREIG